MKHLLTFLLLMCSAFAQTVYIANYSGQEFHGWKRATIDRNPVYAVGTVNGTKYVVGRRLGRSARTIDLHVRLAPGEVVSLDLTQAQPATFTIQPIPGDPLAFFGCPSIANVPFAVDNVIVDGAAYLTHFRARVGRMLHVDLWTTWYPDQPGWCNGEVVVTASNPAVADMSAPIPADFTLRFGQADVFVPGLSPSTTPAQALGACLLALGEAIGDGQARSFPVTLVWTKHLKQTSDWTSAGAASSLSICANGISRLWSTGNPLPTRDLKPLQWTIQHWSGAVERLHSWEAGPLGVTANSGQTGAQEDQVFIGAECMQGIQSLGAETVRYLVALGQSRRPCHFLERDGLQIEPSQHPQCVFWSSRPHWHTGVSPDQLGKSRSLTALDDHGWYGPDREHWLLNTLMVGARLTGSSALQWQLSAQARNILLSETVDPRLSTSSPDAARSIGWMGIIVAHLDENLEDRALAARVVERWRERVTRVYIPQLGQRAGDIWDPRADARITQDIGAAWPQGWMPEQQAVGSYGLDLACSLVGPVEGRALALRGAQAVVNRAFTRDGSRWVEWERLGYLGADLLPATAYVNGQGAYRTGWYRAAWMPMATATVLRNTPGDERARSIWNQQLSDGGAGGTWFAPGVNR